MLVPAVAGAGPVLGVARGAEALTVVLNVAVLLAALLSLVVLVTVAVSVSVVPLGTAGLIVATRVIVRVAPAAKGPTRSVKAVPAPLPSLAETKVSPAGSVSVTNTFWALEGPLLVTVRV